MDLTDYGGEGVAKIYNSKWINDIFVWCKFNLMNIWLNLNSEFIIKMLEYENLHIQERLGFYCNQCKSNIWAKRIKKASLS